MKPNGKGPSVLLLGASGFFGPALCEAFGSSGAVATHFSHASAGSLYFDACSTPAADLVSRLPSKPAAAVILLGITNIDACARDPAGSAEVNVRGIIRVIDDARALGIMPVFVSSDAVFDGSRAYWSEDDEPIPILTYGRQKLEVERHLAALPPPWIVVRLPKLISPERNARCFLSGWVEGLGRRKRILCATDQYFTPAAAPDAARTIAQLVQAQAQGLYHLGGPERLSRRVLLGAVIDEYRKFATPVAEIIDCSLRDIPDLLEPRPLDTSLRSDRFKADFGTPFRAAGEVARAAVQSYFAAQDGRK
ncbi:MAG: sugar nucleotide-binding protein [Pseudomonadota bacterium]